MILAAGDELHRLVARVERGQIDLAVTYVGECAGRRKFGGVAGVYFLWFASSKGDYPNGLGCTQGIAGRIRVLAGGIFFTAADVNERVSVFRKTELRNLLAIILDVRGEPSRRKERSFGDPDVALPFLVEGPGDAVYLLGGGQVFGEVRAQNLFERKGLLCGRPLRETQHRQRQQSASIHRDSPKDSTAPTRCNC